MLLICHNVVSVWCVQRMLTGHEAITYNQCLVKLENAYTHLEVCLCHDAIDYVT